MNILHFISGDLGGGAARGAYWLHEGLRTIGVPSKILTTSVDVLGDPDVTTISKGMKGRLRSALRSRADQLPTILYRNRKKEIFSTGLFGFGFKKILEYKWADIVHLHWVNGGFVNIRHLSGISKPVVWTVRDMWPMTGGCHLAVKCERYRARCGHCPHLGSRNNYDLSTMVQRRKVRHLPRTVKIIGISSWISECARASRVLGGFDVRTIHNGLDTRAFSPVAKVLAREALGIHTDKRIVLTGAQYAASWKGFEHFLRAADKLDRSACHLAFFGPLNPSTLEPLGFSFSSFGVLRDLLSLRLVYSAADVFVAPSTMESFGKTLIESMACGTPVVCFDATGPRDIVRHKIDGYKARPFDTADLATGIEWILNHPQRDELSRKARDRVVMDFDSRVIAAQYVELYKEMMGET